MRLDARPGWWNLPGLWRLARRLRGFDFVYDLQTSARSSQYFRLAGRPPWSGIARGASHPHANPGRDAMHTIERQREQLAMAGIAAIAAPDLGWLAAAGRGFDLPRPYALLAPGAAPHRPAKRWPVARFAALAAALAARGLAPVVIGTAAEAPLADAIRATCGAAIDLTGRTTLPDIGDARRRRRRARSATTPGRCTSAAAMGCRCVVLFSADSDPALTAPARRGHGAALRTPRRPARGQGCGGAGVTP